MKCQGAVGTEAIFAPKWCKYSRKHIEYCCVESVTLWVSKQIVGCNLLPTMGSDYIYRDIFCSQVKHVTMYQEMSLISLTRWVAWPMSIPLVESECENVLSASVLTVT